MEKKYQLPLVIAGLGLSYGLYLFYDFSTSGLASLEQGLQAQESALVAKSGELRKLRNFADNIESVKLSLRELNLQLESALESLPRNYDLSGLLRKVSMIGFNSGVAIGAFRPASEVKQEGEFYETMPIAFNVSGSFTQVLSFFDQLLHLKRVVRVEKVEMRLAASNSEAAVRNAGAAVTTEVVAKLYRFTD